MYGYLVIFIEYIRLTFFFNLLFPNYFKTMPQSKKKKHQPHPPIPQHKINKRRNKVIAVAIIFFLLFGAGIAFFAAGYNYTWIITGAAAGAVGGYFFGKQVVKDLFRK